MADFKPGDTVRLKSGGPLMTVEKTGTGGFTNETKVWCEWFDDKKNHQSKTFAPALLEHDDGSINVG